MLVAETVPPVTLPLNGPTKLAALIVPLEVTLPY